MSHLCAWRAAALRGSLRRCIRNRFLYRYFVLSLASSLFAIILFQKSELIVEGFLQIFGRFRVQFAIRMLLLSVAPQRFLNFPKVS